MELVLLMYNAHPYFSLKNLGSILHIIHDKILYFLFLVLDFHHFYRGI